MTNSGRSSVRFASFEFNRDSGELKKSGARIRISKRSRQLLEELIDNRPGIVSRERLAMLLWGDGLHVDFEDGLNHAVKRLRDVLGDDPREPRFVECITGVGYRFIAEISEGMSAPSEIRVPERPRLWQRAGLALLGASVASLLALAALVWRPGVADEQPTLAVALPLVTVLPFDELTERPTDDGLATAIASAITDELAKIAALRVTSPTSAQLAGGRDGTPHVVATRLGTTHLVTGTVIRTGFEVHVNVRLEDLREKRQVWAGAYRGDLKEPLSIFAEAPRAIAARLQVHVTPMEEERLAAVRPVRINVYEKYHEARKAFELGQYDEAVGLLEETIRLDPDFAPAYSWLADAHLALGYWEARPDPVLERADQAAMRALSLNPTLAEPHLLRGNVVSNFEWRWEEADQHFRKAIELNPNHVRAYLVYGRYLAIVNRPAEAAAMVERALELDPLSAATNGLAGEVYHASRNYTRAAKLLETAVKLRPDGMQYQVQLACIYGGAKEFAKAERHIIRAVDSETTDIRARAIQAWLFSLSGRMSEARRVAQSVESLWNPADKSYYSRAFLYNVLGDRDRAFAVLEETVEARWPFLATSIFLPPFDSLRADPRFKRILEEMGLAEIRERNARRVRNDVHSGSPETPFP